MTYPIDCKIDYNNNKEFRSCLRKLFAMNAEKYDQKIRVLDSIEKLDDETRDEISYDEDASTIMLDYIFDQTKENKLFQKLYVTAALRMFSVDKSIGLAVLFSYDYLKTFHLCLVDYFSSPEKFVEENINYINLMKKIS